MNQLIPNNAAEMACIGKNKTISPLGKVVIEILNIVFRGLHHVDQQLLKKTKWDDDYVICLDFPNTSFATTDFNDLTQLVVLAHDACVRLSIGSAPSKKLRLLFHKRQSTGTYSQRQESLEIAAAMVRQQYRVGEEIK